jgi:hypothetical protein
MWQTGHLTHTFRKITKIKSRKKTGERGVGSNDEKNNRIA